MSESSGAYSFSKLRKIEEKLKLPILSKPKIKYPSIHDIIFHRRHGYRTRYYFTSGHEHLGKPKYSDEKSPFILAHQSQMLAYYRWWKYWTEQSAKKSIKEGAKNAQLELVEKSKDILRRLQVDVAAEKEEEEEEEEEEEKKGQRDGEKEMIKDLNKVTAMTDIDRNYFTDLIGKVGVGERFSKERYVDDARRALRTRLLVGAERDDSIRIDELFHEEQRRLDQTKDNYRHCVNAFEEFLAKDHEESMLILDEAEEEARVTYSLTMKRNKLLREVGQLRLQVYSLEESWRTVRMCQTFLYQISPISWRQEHDYINRSSSGTNLYSPPPAVHHILGRYNNNNNHPVDNTISLGSLIELFEAEVTEAPPPQLYFKDPKELAKVFRSMELQNLNALIHLESLAGPMAEMASNVIQTEALIRREIIEIEGGFNDLQENIRGAEERARFLEIYANELLHGVFRDLTCSESILYLRVFVEDTYESCVAPNDANLDTYTMMHLIEKTYEQLNMELDYLPHEIVRICENEGFKLELKAMRDAEDAARKFELMHRLLAALERIMDVPKPLKKRRQSVIKTVHMGTKEKIPVPSAPLLSDEEMIFLLFFTNYRKLDDPRDFGSHFPDDFDLSFKSKATLAREAEALEISKNEPDGISVIRNKFCGDLIDKQKMRNQ